ncbi:MAG TPA: SDR family NAD(P)-dependent oxidoreductase [Microvirga sp.]|nr:SDR family NAD(P)-dependent oxidoreductase [Microvirga sp.]
MLAGQPLFGLVNNAGITGGGLLQHQPADEVLELVTLNGVSPLVVSQAFLALLGARRDHHGRPGRIVNISSVGGRLVAPFAAACQAGEHALEALSDGLRALPGGQLRQCFLTDPNGITVRCTSKALGVFAQRLSPRSIAYTELAQPGDT